MFLKPCRIALLLLALAAPSHAQERAAEPSGDALPPAQLESPPSSTEQRRQEEAQPASGSSVNPLESVCLMIESAARANDLPLEFFARVIWQESRFRAGAIGPLTRSGDRAQGIAQFMPRTAAERGLLDPLDPVQALPKSAEFLRELRSEFGNLGLAAAAYNAGPQRVRNWIAGSGGMPAETRHYVFAITGTSIDDWKTATRDTDHNLRPAPGCRELVALLKQAPNPFVDELERRVQVGAARPWGVQLSAGFSRDRALASYANLARRYAGVLAGRDPSILAGRLRSRGTRAFYQVRVGAETRAGAEDLCGKIRRAGGACMVLRNPRGAS